MKKEDSIIGCLLGTAIGDAMGLCCEGLSKQRQHRMFADMSRYHFFFGRGMTSDDTEHTCMVAQAMIVSAGDERVFLKSLGWRFRFWLLGLPAGIGYATLRAILKLWFGLSPEKSGVFSAGNGPCMRSAIIGVCYGHDIKKLCELVKACTRITHTDPKAELGALAVALAAHMASNEQEKDIAPYEFYQMLRNISGPEAEEFLELIKKTVESVNAGEATESFAEGLGLSKGVGGYTYHTVPVVIHSWLKNQKDYRSAIMDVIHCGGDTDTSAAILGGIMGARVGKKGIPQEWLAGLLEWPRNVHWMEMLGSRLAFVSDTSTAQKAVPLSVIGLFLRNVFFMFIVIFHGFSRLFPPY